MMRQVLVTDIPRPSGSDIVVVKLPAGCACSRWLAQRVANAIRARISLAEIDRDVVVLNEYLAGPTACVRHIPDSGALSDGAPAGS